MLQFLFGLMAGLFVGLVMEWIVDWQAFMPRLGFNARRSSEEVDATVHSSPSHQDSPEFLHSVDSDSSAHRE